MQHGQMLEITQGSNAEKRPPGHAPGWYFSCKRIVDVVIVLATLLVASPLLLLIAVLIKLDSRGPVLFRQTRVGRNGQPFVFYKFRSMVQGADSRKRSRIHREYVRSLIRSERNLDTTNSRHQQVPQRADVSSSERGTGNSKRATESTFKLAEDPRITRIGHILRRTSLDELPQLLNVLKGEMSLVGPRPPLPYEVEEYEDWHKQRLLTTPGITGLWQVQGRSRVPFDEMVQMDLEYINKQSLWLDFIILVRTIPAVIAGDGAM